MVSGELRRRRTDELAPEELRRRRTDQLVPEAMRRRNQTDLLALDELGSP